MFSLVEYKISPDQLAPLPEEPIKLIMKADHLFIVRVRLLIWLATLLLVIQVSGERHFFKYETVARSADDGHKSYNEIRASALDSQQGAQYFRKTFVEPTSFKQHEANSIEATRLIGSAQNYAAHKLGATKHLSAARRKEFEESFMKQLASHGGLRRGFLRRENVRARTVESPALSVDSGGRSSAGSRLADVISKAFHVEQGHYADIYDRIDSHKPLSTRRPAELIDETVGSVLAAPPARRHERRPRPSGHRHQDD